MMVIDKVGITTSDPGDNYWMNASRPTYTCHHVQRSSLAVDKVIAGYPAVTNPFITGRKGRKA